MQSLYDTMGQVLSNRVGVGVKELAKPRAVASLNRSLSTASGTAASNPANFPRGEGPERDIHDVEQERYLKSQRPEGSSKHDDKLKELPPDLLKFIKDVGPLKQIVDEEFTSPRLLEEGQDEIELPSFVQTFIIAC